MKWLRTLLVLLMCAVLPLTGLAANMPSGRCPMQTMQMSMAEGACEMQECMQGCDAIKAPTGSKAKATLCKAMTQCQSGSVFFPVTMPLAQRPTARYFPVEFHYAQSLSIREPDGLWRPPRAI